MKRKTRRTKVRAFTLLEVLMVVVIIGLLAAFVVPNFFQTGEKAKRDLVQTTVNSGLNGALDLYRMHMGQYPKSDEEGLRALLERPDDEELEKNWAGPYLKKAEDLVDPWGNEYIYECPGDINQDSYDLSSAGPDGQSGNDDDIKNWKES